VDDGTLAAPAMQQRVGSRLARTTEVIMKDGTIATSAMNQWYVATHVQHAVSLERDHWQLYRAFTLTRILRRVTCTGLGFLR